MLEAAGHAFEILSPNVDEAEAKDSASSPEQVATTLACAKALDVSAREPQAWTIGSDSVLSVGGRRFDKPRSRAEAAEHLEFFSGKLMQLTSAVALARNGSVDWRHAETAPLKVRDLSPSFVERYLDSEWPEVGYCVGVFRMEGRGVQLFETIDGDHFSILGMPLLPLLGALRERGLLQS
jgi:septum formation protein